jgi:hypothetical protein
LNAWDCIIVLFNAWGLYIMLNNSCGQHVIASWFCFWLQSGQPICVTANLCASPTCIAGLIVEMNSIFCNNKKSSLLCQFLNPSQFSFNFILPFCYMHTFSTFYIFFFNCTNKWTCVVPEVMFFFNCTNKWTCVVPEVMYLCGTW